MVALLPLKSQFYKKSYFYKRSRYYRYSPNFTKVLFLQIVPLLPLKSQFYKSLIFTNGPMLIESALKYLDF